MATDTTKLFYPSCFGMTIGNVCGLVYERIQDGVFTNSPLEKAPVSTWLTLVDEITMQDFMNAYFAPVEQHMGDEIVPASRNIKMEQAVQALHDALCAKLILRQL